MHRWSTNLVHQAEKRCVIPEVGEHPSNWVIGKEGFMEKAAFEPGLEGVKFDVWL